MTRPILTARAAMIINNARGRGSETPAPSLPPAPVNTALPSITGQPQEGQTLSVSNGAWSNSPTGYAYQWRRNGVAIAGAGASSYLLDSVDRQAMISALVIASNAGGSAAAFAAAVGPVTGAPTPTPTPDEPTTLNADLLPAPIVDLTSAAETDPITTTILVPLAWYETDYVRMRVRRKSDLVVIYNQRILVGTGVQDFPGMESVTVAEQLLIDERGERGIYYGPWSTELEHGPDAVAPVLSNPTGTKTGPNTADLTVSTNDDEGTLFCVVTTSATAPSAAQVIAGQDHTGTAAIDFSQPVTATGVQELEATGLSSAATYYAHFCHRDAASSPNASAVATSASFTTDAAAAPSYAFPANPLYANVGFASATHTFPAVPIGTADALRRVAVPMWQISGDTPTGMTIGGATATLRGGTGNQGIWVADVPAGATADIVITAPGNLGFIFIAPYTLTNYNPVPTETPLLAYTFNNSPQTVAANTPSGDGITVVAGLFETLTGAAVAEGGTLIDDEELAGLNWTVAIMLKTTDGAGNAGFSGFGNINSSLIGASWTV
jgi:hypothetical protein